MKNIAQALITEAAKNPNRIALICKGSSGYQKWTFEQLADQVSLCAQALTREGINPGDRVMLMVKPSMEFVALTFALFALGATVILVDPGMGFKNLLKCIGAVKPLAFIAIPKAHIFKKIFPKPFNTVRINICVGPSFGLLGKSLQSILGSSPEPLIPIVPEKDDLAAIIFTTGSTGPPKGVQYQHGIFQAQLAMIRDYYGIQSGEIDQPAFPLFALFSIALGATAVIPDMDPTRPAQVDPEKFVKTINDHGVTYSFGSPTIWNVVSRYCLAKQIKLPTLRKILMAGAPVPGDLVERTKAIMAENGEVHTPYGATECLPIISMTGSEIVSTTWQETKKGKGTCVGRALPGIIVHVIKPVDGPIAHFAEKMILPEGEVGEIIVQGEVVTRAYDHNDAENLSAKISDGDGGFWHRIGDMGYFDSTGRLWFCGRKAHRVITSSGPMYSVCCEAVFNNHKDVYRSALVGVGPSGNQLPVLIVEPNKKINCQATFYGELREIAKRYSHTENIEKFLINKSFPVDIRHNAKIFREKLAVWAVDQIKL
jgi:acyl-CoA synthetase (AMP-forming)/AMP-acid ligase II